MNPSTKFTAALDRTLQSEAKRSRRRFGTRAIGNAALFRFINQLAQMQAPAVTASSDRVTGAPIFTTHPNLTAWHLAR